MCVSHIKEVIVNVIHTFNNKLPFATTQGMKKTNHNKDLSTPPLTSSKQNFEIPKRKRQNGSPIAKYRIASKSAGVELSMPLNTMFIRKSQWHGFTT